MKRSIALLTAVFCLLTATASMAYVHLPATSGAPRALPAFFDGFFGGGQKSDTGKPGSVHPINDDASFAASSRTINARPYNKSEMFFNITIPNDWEAAPIQTEKQEFTSQIMGNIASFTSPFFGTARAEIIVQAVQLTHEVNAYDWLKHYVLSNSYTPDGDAQEINRWAANIHYYASSSDGQSKYVYMTVRMNGDIALVARFEMPVPLKGYLAFMQKKTIDSFTLAYPKEGRIEQQKTFTLADAMKVSYPASWDTVAPDFRDMNNLKVQLHNTSKSGAIEGFVYIKAIRRSQDSNLLKEAEVLREFFDKDIKVDVEKLVATRPTDIQKERFLFKRYETYELKSRRAGHSLQEVHLVALGDRDWYIFLFLITPREQENLYLWARNVRAFRDIVHSIE